MKYLDKNGLEWSIEKGDWPGSFSKKERHLIKNSLSKVYIPLILIAILSVILMNMK